MSNLRKYMYYIYIINSIICILHTYICKKKHTKQILRCLQFNHQLCCLGWDGGKSLIKSPYLIPHIPCQLRDNRSCKNEEYSNILDSLMIKPGWEQGLRKRLQSDFFVVFPDSRRYPLCGSGSLSSDPSFPLASLCCEQPGCLWLAACS